MQDLTTKHSYIDIINEFRNLIDFINYDEVLLEKLFQIISNHFNFEAIGIFLNSPDNLKTNTLELFTRSADINTKKIETSFFNSMSKFKQIIKSETKLHYYQHDSITIDLKNELTLPFLFNEKLLGGICIYSSQEILKEDIETFNLIVREFLSIFKLRYIYSEQVFKSSIDALTGLYNRNQFDIGLTQEFNRAERYKTPFSIAMIDIDHFKKINDNFGHQFGDYVLKEIAKIIQHAFRKTDIVYRYGGEEIVIIMPETPVGKAYLPLEKLRKNIVSHNFLDKKVTISIGVAEYKNDTKNGNEIVKNADIKLYQAKQNGRNIVCS